MPQGNFALARFSVSRRAALKGLLSLPFVLHTGAAHPASRIPSALGYLPWWTAPGWTGFPLADLDRLALFDAPVGPDGSVLDREWPKRAPGLAERCARAGVPIDVTLTLLEQAHFGEIFQDPARRARLLDEARRLLAREFVGGLHLDVEGYSDAAPAAIEGFRAWLRELDLHRSDLGKGLSAFFPASDRFRPYDAAAAKRIDYWVAQLYDAHWPEAPVTGPLVTRSAENPVGVRRALARLAALGVRREAMLLSVPLYGWEWPSASAQPGAATRGRAKLLTYTDTPEQLMPQDRLAATRLAREHGLRRDAEGTPYYAYRNGAQWVQGWFEDLDSLSAKLTAERTQGYAGLAFFPLGYDQGAIVEPMLRWWKGAR